MKNVLILVLMLLYCSCQKHEDYSHDIYRGNKLNNKYLTSIEQSEKALLLGMLYVYGNNCNENTKRIKCEILEELNIVDECDPNYIDFLKGWFVHDELMKYKFQNCPVMEEDGPIQNEIKKLITRRVKDTIGITIKVIGMNTAQEKNWNIEQKMDYIIRNNSFIKLYK